MARPMPRDAPVMRAVLVEELVMRDLLSSFVVASPRDRAVFVAPASLGKTRLYAPQLSCVRSCATAPTGGFLSAVPGVLSLWSSRTTYPCLSCSRRIHSRI